MLGLKPKSRGVLVGSVAVITTMALSAGIATAKGTSAPEQLNHATANNIDAIVGQALGAGWTPPPNPSPADGKAVKYPPPGASSSSLIVRQHPKMALILDRSDDRDVSQGGTLNVHVGVLSFPGAKNAGILVSEVNKNITPVGSFQTAGGTLPYYSVSFQATGANNGQPTMFTGYETESIQVNSFIVAVQTNHDQLATRTDALPVLQAVTTAVVKYLKTGAQ